MYPEYWGPDGHTGGGVEDLVKVIGEGVRRGDEEYWIPKGLVTQVDPGRWVGITGLGNNI